MRSYEVQRLWRKWLHTAGPEKVVPDFSDHVSLLEKNHSIKVSEIHTC